MIGDGSMEVLTNLMVVKRNGKKVDFDGNKIALAIKKGFENWWQQSKILLILSGFEHFFNFF